MGELIRSTTGPQVHVVIDTPPTLPAAKADPNQLEMALLNLAVNARDAMPDGGTLRISTHEDHVREGVVPGLRKGDYIKISVADTGTGMDQATLARAVEPFFSTKGVGKGTGLGLSMVHGLAQQLGGALKVSSRPGFGTNIEIWIPQTAEELPGAESDIEITSSPSLSRATVLLVDDEELVRLSTADMLVDLGYKVVEAASAQDALALIDNGIQFDLLVTDHLMPGMTGTELADITRLRRPGTAVILISGYAEDRGIDPKVPRLTKPFRKQELSDLLQAIVVHGERSPG
ncbi:ATP-binding protein [Rhizobium sp. Root1204]|uniref:ATP-binding protein n=1 Tax=Rhizobium sp. Root1204 TaxID=1736428 RepID=UPI000715D4CE|nr:ATP-binding protein [Rhizobium sp. Root1204]KQV33017.1 hypothetical protein ASC96_30670 [Rhizobium sp. Root1204]